MHLLAVRKLAGWRWCIFLLPLWASCRLAAGDPGTFDPSANASSFSRIYNATSEEDSWLGYSCASIGDFNGDGIGDIIVGAPGTEADIGRAYVVYGNASGIGENFDLSDVENGDGVGLLLSGSSGGKFSHSIGYAVAAAGDVNGDSLMDVIVGAFGSSYSVAGAAHVVYGTKSSAAYNASFLDLGAGGNGGLDGFDGFTVWGVEMEAEIYATLPTDTIGRQLSLQYTGNPLSTAGDVNGDGYDDILVGSPAAGTLSQGFVYLVFGGVGLSASLDLRTDVDGTNVVVFKGAMTDRAGFAVSGGFDVNGDGLSDFVIGAPEGGTVGTFDGEAYVVFGQESIRDIATVMLDTDLNGTNGFSIIGPSEDAYAGSAVAGAGDVNGDGYDDVIIGAFGDEPTGRYRQGAAFVVFGRAEGDFDVSYDLKLSAVVDGATAASLPGLRAQDALGISVGSAGDINGDGLADLWVGAPNADPQNVESAGIVYVVFGSQNSGEDHTWGSTVDISSLDGSNGFMMTGATANGHFGWSGAGGVDLNQDGFSDLMVGAFVVPGVFVVFGHDDDTSDNTTAVTLAIISGVLGCLFCAVYEARVWLARKEAKEEAVRQAELEIENERLDEWRMNLGKSLPGERDKPEDMRDINEGCEVVEAGVKK